MKNLLLVFIALLMISCVSDRTILQISPGQMVELDYPNYDSYEAEIKNKTGKSINVAVLNKDTDKQESGFGIGIKSEQKTMVGKDSKLVFTNNGNAAASLSLLIREKEIPAKQSEDVYKNFTLRNNSVKSIPLIIPNVMNPNLSPFSNSGVSLKIGQKIFFKTGGKKYLLLTVDETIENDSKIDVGELIKERKKELGVI